MKDEYIQAKIETIEFESEDVITSSLCKTETPRVCIEGN